LCAITYLKVSTLLFQTFNCFNVTEEDGSTTWRLAAESSTVCFEGDHMLLTVFTCFTLLPFVILTPILMGKRLRANFHDDMHVTRKVLFERVERFGFLVRHLVREFYWFQLLIFLLNLCFAARIVFVTVSDLAIFMAGMLFLFRLSLLITLRPYERLIKFSYECVVGTFAGKFVARATLSRIESNTISRCCTPACHQSCNRYSHLHLKQTKRTNHYSHDVCDLSLSPLERRRERQLRAVGVQRLDAVILPDASHPGGCVGVRPRLRCSVRTVQRRFGSTVAAVEQPQRQRRRHR
jgi:hypothetical protein